MSSDLGRQRDLQAHYADARYRLALPDGVCERRVGVRDASADRRLRVAGCRRQWFVLTACNPQSRVLAETENAARLAELETDLAARAWPCLASVASAADGSWPEAGFCIFDADDDAVRALALRYGQNAIVGGVLGAAPVLIWLAPRDDS